MTPGERPPPARHYYWLDWVRFLAAAIVVFGHVSGFNWAEWPASGLVARPVLLNVFLSATQVSRQAVVVFFVLSGLLVGGKVIERVRTGTFDAAAYAADRIARVYVPLIPAVLLTMAIVPFTDQPWSPWPYLRCLTGTQELFAHTPSLNAPLWTLAYEVWFYLLAGCAAVTFCGQGMRWQRFAGAAGVAVSCWIMWQMEPAYLLCWLLGTAGFWLSSQVESARGAFAVAGAFVALVGSLIYQFDLGSLAPVPCLWLPPPYSAQVIVAAGSLLLIAALMSVMPDTRLGRRIESWGTLLAASSYTLYLTHYPIVYLFAQRMGRMPPAITLHAVGRGVWWTAACAVVALTFYVLFEARTVAVRRWLRARFGAGSQTIHFSRLRRANLP